MKIIASADLGGLGAKEGEPVTCQWTVPSLAPALIPWLAMLGLLMLKPNRCGPAWWVWAPLSAAIGIGLAMLPWDFLPSELVGILLDISAAMAFGLAAVWLLAPVLGRRGLASRVVSVPLVLALSSVVVVLGRHGLDRGDVELEPVAIMLASCSVFLPAALFLAARFCRKRYGRIKFTLWVAVILALAWAALVITYVAIDTGGRVPLVELFIPILIVTGFSFSLLLPFLILAFANPFYHDRLKSLLRLGATASPDSSPAAPYSK